MNKRINKLLPNNTNIEMALKRTTLISCFNVKDNIDFEHNHDLIYYTKCPEPTSFDHYMGESDRRITGLIKDDGGRDHTSHVLKRSIEKSHKNVTTTDFKIINKNFHNTKRKRNIAEALWIKDL